MTAAVFTRRPPEVMMSTERARAVVPDALSFPRAAMRELVRGQYRVSKLRFELDADGRGEILYQLTGGGRVFHFFLVSDMLPEDSKTDRNYAASWDAMGVLCQGEWTPEREALLRREVPKQRAGFADYDTLIYARGNRSTRIFNHVVDSLAQGRQPDLDELAPVGYILRTTAFIGNGQLGTLPLDGYDADHPLRRPYHAQFCSGFMLREYVFDLVDHLALVRNPKAVRLAPEYRRFLGLGNSAATGLAAYATNHPQQMNGWSVVHEDAWVNAMQREPVLTGELANRFSALLAKAARHFAEGARPDDGVFASPQCTSVQLLRIQDAMQTPAISAVSSSGEKSISLEHLVEWARANVHAEASEVLHSLILELHPAIAIDAVDSFRVCEDAVVQPEMTAGELLGRIEKDFDWVISCSRDGTTDESTDVAAEDPAYFWYRSSQAPRDVRRGLRRRLAHLEFETNMDFPLQLRQAWQLLRAVPPDRPLAGVLCERPDLRHAIARVQSQAGAQYCDLRQPWLSARYTPFEATRFVLAFYGMEKFEAAFPKSVRGTFMQGAPIAEDVAAGRDGRWPFTLKPDLAKPGAQSELAPLPPNAGMDVAVTVTATAPEPDDLTFAPRELARAVQTALQGHGMPLGVAEEAGALVALAQHRGEPAVATALLHCEDCRVSPFMVPDPARSWPDGGDPLVLHAYSASALATAPVALDLALARSLRSSHGVGAVLMVKALDAWLVRSIVLRGARKGVLTVLLWRAPDAAGDPVCGYAVAGPQDAGAWYSEGGITGHCGNIAETLARSAHWASLQGDGFLIACMRPDAVVEGDIASPAAALSDALMAASAAHNGIKLSRTEYNALLKAGSALLVPQAVEHFVLLEGADPLKTF